MPGIDQRNARRKEGCHERTVITAELLLGKREPEVLLMKSTPNSMKQAVGLGIERVRLNQQRGGLITAIHEAMGGQKIFITPAATPFSVGSARDRCDGLPTVEVPVEYPSPRSFVTIATRLGRRRFVRSYRPRCWRSRS
jgi:hypothetical protein